MTAPASVKPWDVRGWRRDRLRELLYHMLSWPYLVATAVTIRFLQGPTEILRDAMFLSWLTALGNRGYKAWLAFKQNGNGGGKPSG
jgi:hypothetical protein